MLRVAVLEKEMVAKDIIFELGKRLEQEWTFRYFTKISEFAKAWEQAPFQIVFFHERFNIDRVTKTFVLPNIETMFIYTMEGILPQDFHAKFQRILYMKQTNIKQEFERIYPQIQDFLNINKEFLFSYHNVSIPLKMSDIFYIEKEDKQLVYHTRRGDFRERKTMKKAWDDMQAYNFLWIHASYMVNVQYIIKIECDLVYLANVQLPLARARKQTVLNQLRGNIQ